MERELICINCPIGCRMLLRLDGDTVTRVEGNLCPKGPAYARQEAVCPMRVLTSLMFAANREKPFSVKSDAPIPKGLLFDCVDRIYQTHPEAPLSCGDIIIRDILGTGSNIVSTRDVP